MIIGGTSVFTQSNAGFRGVTEGPAQGGKLPTVEVELNNGRVFRQEDGQDLVSIQDGVSTPCPGFQFDRFTVANTKHFLTPRDDHNPGGLRFNHHDQSGKIDGCQELYNDGGGKVFRFGPDGGLEGAGDAVYRADGRTELMGFGNANGRVQADASAMTWADDGHGHPAEVEFYFTPASLGARF